MLTPTLILCLSRRASCPFLSLSHSGTLFMPPNTKSKTSGNAAARSVGQNSGSGHRAQPQARVDEPVAPSPQQKLYADPLQVLQRLKAPGLDIGTFIHAVFPLRWLDSTPIGRVIARFIQDMRSLDGSLPNEFQSLFETTITLILRFGAVIAFSLIFTAPGALVFIIGIWIGQIYIAAQLSVKREMSNARSPLFSYFGATPNGITSMRAYGAEDQLRGEALKRLDKYTRATRTFYNLNARYLTRWICICMDALGGAFAARLAAYLVYVNSTSHASNTDFSLSMAVSFSSGILWWVRILNDFEVQGNSLERIQDYVAIEQ
ncbi:hypothetical protein BDV93DRAFT_559981 [Ceratobasidium sp. AG-I]|nr:hypothetical protein BDV93DRAFT_559981 [Ceratobasidium sp. AG-I]